MEGRQVIRAFLNADFTRKVASTNFSSYLNLEPPEDLTKALRESATLMRHREAEMAERKKARSERRKVGKKRAA